jgi:hypothetical protein
MRQVIWSFFFDEDIASSSFLDMVEYYASLTNDNSNHILQLDSGPVHFIML